MSTNTLKGIIRGLLALSGLWLWEYWDWDWAKNWWAITGDLWIWAYLLISLYVWPLFYPKDGTL